MFTHTPPLFASLVAAFQEEKVKKEWKVHVPQERPHEMSSAALSLSLWERECIYHSAPSSILGEPTWCTFPCWLWSVHAAHTLCTLTHTHTQYPNVSCLAEPESAAAGCFSHRLWFPTFLNWPLSLPLSLCCYHTLLLGQFKRSVFF